VIVVDASVLVNALTHDGPAGRAGRDLLSRDLHWAAPEHLVVEIFSAVRGLHLRGVITTERASDALDSLSQVAIETVNARHLLPRMWELRRNVSGYDAAYVAAAESLRCPLVTADARLARVGALRCEVRLALPVG
jgi:predicted nucleic acid-binding protein